MEAILTLPLLGRYFTLSWTTFGIIMWRSPFSTKTLRYYTSLVESLKDYFPLLVGVVDFFEELCCWRGDIVGCSFCFLFPWFGWTWFYGSFEEVIMCGGCGQFLTYNLLLGAVDIEEKIMTKTVFRISNRNFCGNNTEFWIMLHCQC